MKEFLTKAGIAVLAVFAPVKSIMIVVGVLVIADLITGILAARKRGEPITSAGFRRSVAKTLIYQSAIMLSFLTQQYLVGDDLFSIVKVTAGIIGMTELYSCVENLNVLNGSPIFKALLDKLGSKNDQLLK
jgi:phage-related holin